VESEDEDEDEDEEAVLKFFELEAKVKKGRK
jgi:hypothetical protein